MTHNQKGNGYLELAKTDTFHMQQYAYMIQRMGEIKNRTAVPCWRIR